MKSVKSGMLLMAILLGVVMWVPVTVRASEENGTSTQPASSSEGFSYVENEDGSLTITSYLDKEATSLVIPEEIDGKQVTAIGKLTLEELCPLEEVTIPSSVKSIDRRAFCYIIPDMDDAWKTYPIEMRTEPGSYAEEWTIHHEYGATMTIEKVSQNGNEIQLRAKVLNKTFRDIDGTIDVSICKGDSYTSFGTYEGDSVKFEDEEWKVLLKAKDTTEFLVNGTLPDDWEEEAYISLSVQIRNNEEGRISYDLVCGKTYTSWENRHEHTYGDWQTTKEPTYTEKGLRTKTCTGCGDVVTEEIPMLNKPAETPTNPDSQKPVETPTNPVSQQPTTQQPVASAETAQIGETVKQGTDSYLITSTEDGNMTVTYKESGNESTKVVTVPDKVVIAGKEYIVTNIAADAFKNNKKVTNIKIGKNITKIGKNAFKNCKNLKKITITSTKLTKKSIGKNAFKGTNGKLVVKVPKNKKKEYAKFLKAKGNKKIVIK